MHLILIYLLVIMLLGYVTGSNVQDLSDICTKGRIHDTYLTFGIGYSDYSVSMLTAQTSFNCILSFTVKATNYIMIILEFPDLMPKEKVCVSKEASNDLVMVSDYNEKKNCQYTGSEPAYRSLSLEKANIQLTSSGHLNTIKVTATTMRGLKDFECLEANETECNFAAQVYCMDKKVACDGHINCGVPDAYDEDISLCKGQSLSFLMKLSSLLMGILTVFLCGSICLILMPKRKETFVYRVDEASKIYDAEVEIVNAEINIKILFSENVKLFK